MGKDTIWGVVIISVLALLVGSGIYVKHAITSSKIKYDLETLCPESEEHATFRVLVDKTDPWDEDSGKRFNKIITKLKGSLSIYQRLTIYTITETGNEIPKRVFDMCNPGKGEQANSLYENPRLIKKKFDAEFGKPLDAIITQLMIPGTAPKSPIIEAVWYLKPRTEGDTLIIVSDLMQNSDLISFYKNVSSWSIKKLTSPAWTVKRYQTIKVYFIDRPNIDPRIKDAAVAFWKTHLEQISNEVIIETL